MIQKSGKKIQYSQFIDRVASKVIVDRDLLQKRIKRFVISNRRKVDFLLSDCANEMVERLSLINRDFSAALVLGDHSDVMAKHLVEQKKVKIKNITVQSPFRFDDFIQSDSRLHYVIADEESLCFNHGSFDVVMSFLSMQHINILPQYLVSIHKFLRSDGVFLACFVGGNSLRILRESLLDAEMKIYDGVSARVLPFIDIRVMGDLLQKLDFKMIVTDIEPLRYSYSKFTDIFTDLRSLGWSNSLIKRSRRLVSRSFFNEVECNYRKKSMSTTGDSFIVDYEIVWLICWTPGVNQPQPLAPGSAQISLADFIENHRK